MKNLRKIGKWTLWLAGLLAALFLLAWVLLQRPAVQQWAVNRITADLSQRWGAKVAIDKVDIRFFKTLALEGIYLQDQNQDTLLYAEKLAANISLFSIFDQQLHVQGISLEHAVAQVKRTGTDSSYNFSFLLAQPKTKAASNPSESYWDIDLEKVRLNDLRLTLEDEWGGTRGEVVVDELAIDVEDLDLSQQKLVVEQLKLSQAVVNLKTIQKKGPKEQEDRTGTNTDSPLLAWPSFPWDIEVEQVQLSNNKFDYQQYSIDSIGETVGSIAIELAELNAQLEAISWKEKQGQLQLSNLSFLAQNGIQVDNLTGAVDVSENGIEVKDWSLTTPNSEIGIAAKMDFPVGGLRRSNWQETKVAGNIKPTQIAIAELEEIWPFINQWLRTDVAGTAIDLSGVIGGTLGELALSQASIGIANRLRLNAQLSAQNWWSKDNALLLLQGISLQTSYEALEAVVKKAFLPSGLKTLGQISVSLGGGGSWDNFRLGRLALSTSSGTQLLANGRIKNREQWENSQFELTINSFSTSAAEWRGFSPGLPPLLDSLGIIQGQASGLGSLSDFKVTSLVEGDWGQLDWDIAMQTGRDWRTAGYQLTAALRPSDIGNLISIKELEGPILIEVAANGQGLTWPDLTADLQAQIKQATYKGYAYPTVTYNGKLEKGNLANHLMAANADLDIDLKSKVALNDSLLAVDFDIAIKELSTQALHLTDSALAVQLTANGRFEGNTLDELTGELNLNDVYIANDSLDYRTTDINLISEIGEEQERRLALSTDFLAASMTGDFEPSRLGILLLDLLDHHFKLETVLDTQWVVGLDSLTYNSALRDQSLTADFHLKDARPFQILALPALKRLDQAQLNLKVDHSRQRLALTASVDSLKYANLNLDEAQIFMTGNPDKMDGQAVLKLARKGSAGLESVKLNTHWQNDSLQLALNIADTLAAEQLAIGGQLTQKDQQFLLHLDPDLVLNGKSWQVAPGHLVHLKPNWFEIDELRLQKDAQTLLIESESQGASGRIAPLKLTFEQFELSEVSDLFRFPDSLINGHVDGYVDFYDLDQKPYFTADISVPDLLWYQQQMGTLQLSAEQDLSRAAIQLKLGLNSEENRLGLTGSYQTKTQELDITTVIDQLNLRFLNPVTTGVLTANEGSISGNIAVKGNLSDPRISGTIEVDTFSTYVPFAHSKFRIPATTLQVDNRALRLEPTTIRDELGHTADLFGEIRHKNFSDFQLDLKVLTDRFRFLNTTVADNELFYGQLFVRSDITVTGPLGEPRLDINATSLSPSTFHLSPFSVEESIVQEDEFVIFGQPSELEKRKASEAFYTIKNSFPFDIRVNLDLSDNTEFQFIIDPASGDKLVAHGFANLVLRMTPSGNIRLNGVYTVSSGTYSFSYGQVLRRVFDIREGGRVTFNGNPLDAKFDLVAAYTLRTSTYPLIDSDSQLDAREEAQSKERNPLNVVLDLNGDLNQPALKFAIEVPQENGSLIDSRVQRRLELLNKNPNELNRQVFSLLLFQNFIQSDQHFSFNVAETGESVAYSSVASLFSSQLNKLADNYVKGVEINFDIDAYRDAYSTDNSEMVTQLDVDLSKQFFNNRLKIQAGTNVDLRNNGSQANINALSGDYVIEYKLTKKGNYLLRVFRKDEFDILLDENTAKTGFSIFFKKAFDSKRTKK